MPASALKIAKQEQTATETSLKIVAGKAWENQKAREAIAAIEVFAPTDRNPHNMEPIAEDLQTQQKIPQADASIFSSAFTTFCIR